MKKLKKNKVKEYFAQRTDEELKHCPDCLACACNDAAIIFNHNSGLDLMKLLFFNDPIPALHTHSYGFNTATGRHIIETTQEYYYKYKNLEL